MPLRPLPYREVQRRLEAVGFREVASGTQRSILRQAGLSVEEWERLWG
jgi:hypothetical protein